MYPQFLFYNLEYKYIKQVREETEGTQRMREGRDVESKEWRKGRRQNIDSWI